MQHETAVTHGRSQVTHQVTQMQFTELALGMAQLRGLHDRIWPLTCGAKGTRTPGLLDANQTLFQLSYSPGCLPTRVPGAYWLGRIAGQDEPQAQSRGYLSRRDRRRSASGLPPVWQVGQYCSAESANETSLIVSPHTGQSCP